jgi:phospholipase C
LASPGYGLRVPAILISPYARKGYIDNTQLDFTSILKFIESNWNVPPLASRDTAASNFLPAFDFSQALRNPEFISSVLATSTGAAKKNPSKIIYATYGFALGLSVIVIGSAYIRQHWPRARKVENINR